MNKGNRLTWRRKRKIQGILFVSPFLIGAIVFILVPIIQSCMYSFSKLTITETGYRLDPVGLENYRYIFQQDASYNMTLISTVKDMVVNVFVTVMFSFFIASVLNSSFRGRGLVRAIFFLPLIVSSGLVLQLESADKLGTMISSGQKTALANGTDIAGAFATTLQSLNLGSGAVQFLVDSVSRISTIVMMSAVPIIIFLAGFQAVSPSLFEAAHMDGATRWEEFWKISFPMVSPLILVSTVYCVVDSLNNSNNPMVQMAHNTLFRSFKFGTGSAMIWIYMLVTAAFLGLVYFVINRFVFYYD